MISSFFLLNIFNSYRIKNKKNILDFLSLDLFSLRYWNILRFFDRISLKWCHYTQHNDTQLNDIQHKRLNCAFQDNVMLSDTFVLLCWGSNYLIFILPVIILNAIVPTVCVVCYGAVIVTGLNVTFIIQGTEHNVVLRDTFSCYAECRCAKCCCALAVTSVGLYFKTFIATADFV